MYPIPSPKEIRVPTGETKFEFTLRLGPTTQSLWWQHGPCPLPLPVHSPVPVGLNKWMASTVVFSAGRERRHDLQPIFLLETGSWKTTAVGEANLPLGEPIGLYSPYEVQAVACISLRCLKTRRTIPHPAHPANTFSTRL